MGRFLNCERADYDAWHLSAYFAVISLCVVASGISKAASIIPDAVFKLEAYGWAFLLRGLSQRVGFGGLGLGFTRAQESGWVTCLGYGDWAGDANVCPPGSMLEPTWSIMLLGLSVRV